MGEVPKWKKRCTECNKRFLSIRRHTKYCSSLCRHRAVIPLQPRPTKRKCAWCDVPFRPKQKNNARFCSEKCSFRQYTDDRRPQYNIRMRNLNYNARLNTPWLPLIKSARGRAIEKNVPFDLTAEWGQRRWTGCCELSKIKFNIGIRGSGPKFFSPSIDRIEPTKGYVENNCRFVLWGINAFKHDATDTDVFMVAKALITNRPSCIEAFLALPG